MSRVKRIKIVSVLFVIISYLIFSIQIFATGTTTTETTTESTTDTSTDGSDGSWATVHIDQLRGFSDGCTMMTQIHIMQNSGLIPEDSEYYIKDGFWDCYETSEIYSPYSKCLTKIRTPGVGLKGVTEVIAAYNEITGATWTLECSNYEGADASSVSSWQMVYAFNGKKINQMTKAELVQMFQAFWNNDYWVIIGINGASSHKKTEGNYMGNGTDYIARHWVMMSGVTQDEVYWLDSASSAPSSTTNKYYSDTEDAVIQHIVLLKCDKVSLREAAGGKKLPGKGQSGTDTEGDNDLGISQEQFMGFYAEKDLSAYCELAEVDMSLLYLDNATLNNLNQEEVQAIDDWKENLDINNQNKGLVGILRKAVQLFGILITVWSVFVYLSYWFDRLNNFVDIDLLNILTFGKFRISDTEEESTYKMLKHNKGQRTVNHRNILTITVIAITFGALLITGVIYDLIMWLILKIIHLFR